MTASRYQHLISSIAVFVVAIVVAWLSFTQEPAEAFLFPRLIAIAFAILAAWNFARAAAGMAKVGAGLDKASVLNILPGVLVVVIYVFFAAKTLGFYVSSTAAFLLIYTLYDPVPLSSGGSWLKRIFVTVVFMAVIYGLFAFVLKVQTPRGFFI